VIFVDSNIPMYLVGADHAHKRDTITLLETLITEKKRLVTNTEVLQEILHRYTAIKRKDAIQPCLDALYGFIDQILPVSEEDCSQAKDLLLAYENLSARDALHAAHMSRLKIDIIFSFDKGFDILPKIKRIS
jgi:hypothetical protein